jgi:hypothetical protein
LAEGAGLDAQGRHSHNITVTTIGGPGTAVELIGGNQLYSTSSGVIATTVESEHTHNIVHTHNIGHTHGTGHTHGIAHDHGIAHTHGIGHTHGISHTHGIDHTHGYAHTHGTAHTHGIAHTHGTAHTHGIDHTHTITHTHTFTPVVDTVYGIYRESALNTYAITDLEYRVNAGSWADLSGATSLGGGWYRLGITASVYSSTTFRPLQERNTLQIRRKSAAVADKTVTVDAQLFIRQTIQAVAYTA